MLNIITQNGKQFVLLSELYSKLELHQASYSRFIKEQLTDNAYATKDIEYSTLGMKTTEKGGRPKEDFILTLDFAKDIIIRSKSKVGKTYRDWLISIETKVNNNKLVTLEKTALMYQMLNTFRFGEYQLQAEGLHKDRFILTAKAKDNVHKVFYENRNALLGINNEELKASLLEAFQKGLAQKPQAKNIRSRIALLDRYKLIRNAVADYLLSTGVDTHNAITFADSVMEVAKIAGVEIRIKDEDNLFEQKENVPSPQILGIKQAEKLLLS